MRAVYVLPILILASPTYAHQGEDHECKYDRNSSLTDISRAVEEDAPVCVTKFLSKLEFDKRYLKLSSGNRVQCEYLSDWNPNTDTPISHLVGPGERSCFEVHIQERERELDSEADADIMKFGVEICRAYRKPREVCERVR